MSKEQKIKKWLIKVYIIEKYYKEAETKKEALELVNLDGNPTSVNTIKITAKQEK